jgi:hypothetical protein
VQGTGDLRKLRFLPETWPIGKSGALRVCYVYFEEVGEVLLVLIYAKSEKESVLGGPFLHLPAPRRRKR